MIIQFSRWAVLSACLFVIGTPAFGQVILSDAEIEQVLSHGPWPQELQTDPSNKASGNPAAISLGEALFSAPELSHDGALSCASCHNPDQSFIDGLARAAGRQLLDRNTPTLTNLTGHRWFGWAGDSDSLWGQSLLPIINPDELGHSPESLKTALLQSQWRADFETVFGPLDPQRPDQVLVNVGKALAAYQETLVTGRTSFDRFRDALDRGDVRGAATYSHAAQRGLQIFLGKGRCGFCHVGANFTNGEFHDAGVPYFIGPGQVDTGRHGGLQKLRKSPFTLAGDYSDDPEKSGAWVVRNVRARHSDFGMFRVPSLRGVARTAPYMHDGSIATLSEVIDHYNDLNIDRLHADGEAILRPLDLSGQEAADLLAFLLTLSDDQPVENRP